MQVLTAIAQAVIAATQVIFARLYGATVLGTYQTAYAMVEVLARGGTGGADKAMLRYVASARAAGDGEGVRRALGTGLRLCLVVSGCFSAVLAVAAEQIAALLREETIAPVLRLMAPLPVLLGCLYILIQATLAARITRANFYVRGLLEPGALLLAGVAAFFLGTGLPGLAVAHVTSASLTLIVAVLVVRRLLRPEEVKGVLSAPAVPGLARFSLPIAGGEMLNAVYQRVDILIITAFVGPDMVAYYAAGELLTRVVANIRYAFDSIVAGVISETWHLGQHDRLRYNLRLTIRWVITAAGPLAVLLIVLRRDLLDLWGPEWTAASGAVAVLACSHFINASTGLVAYVLLAAGYSRLALFNNTLGVLFNLGMCLVLTPRYGITGTALSVLGTIALVQGLCTLEAYLITGIHMFEVALLKPLLAVVATGLLQAWVASLVQPVGLRVAAVILAGVVCYVGLLLLLRLPPEERRIAQRLLTVLRLRSP